MNNKLLWRAAPYAPPPQVKTLGQVVSKGSEAFLSSPTLAFAVDLTGVLTAGWVSSKLGSKSKITGEPINKAMSVFWVVVATGLGMKALHDLSRMNA